MRIYLQLVLLSDDIDHRSGHLAGDTPEKPVSDGKQAENDGIQSYPDNKPEACSGFKAL